MPLTQSITHITKESQINVQNNVNIQEREESGTEQSKSAIHDETLIDNVAETVSVNSNALQLSDVNDSRHTQTDVERECYDDEDHFEQDATSLKENNNLAGDVEKDKVTDSKYPRIENETQASMAESQEQAAPIDSSALKRRFPEIKDTTVNVLKNDILELTNDIRTDVITSINKTRKEDNTNTRKLEYNDDNTVITSTCEKQVIQKSALNETTEERTEKNSSKAEIEKEPDNAHAVDVKNVPEIQPLDLNSANTPEVNTDKNEVHYQIEELHNDSGFEHVTPDQQDTSLLLNEEDDKNLDIRDEHVTAIEKSNDIPQSTYLYTELTNTDIVALQNTDKGQGSVRVGREIDQVINVERPSPEQNEDLSKDTNYGPDLNVEHSLEQTYAISDNNCPPIAANAAQSQNSQTLDLNVVDLVGVEESNYLVDRELVTSFGNDKKNRTGDEDVQDSCILQTGTGSFKIGRSKIPTEMSKQHKAENEQNSFVSDCNETHTGTNDDASNTQEEVVTCSEEKYKHMDVIVTPKAEDVSDVSKPGEEKFEQTQPVVLENTKPENEVSANGKNDEKEPSDIDENIYTDAQNNRDLIGNGLPNPDIKTSQVDKSEHSNVLEHSESEVKDSGESNLAQDMFTDVHTIDGNSNPFFTGRLPTLISLEESIKCEYEEAILDNNASNDMSDQNAHEDNNEEAVTASSEIKRLIAEINAPAHMFAISKEKPLTPRELTGELTQIYISNSNETVKVNTDEARVLDNKIDNEHTQTFDPEDIDMKIADLQSLTSHVLESSYSERKNHFEHLDHIQRIDKYVEDMTGVDENNPLDETDTIKEVTEVEDITLSPTTVKDTRDTSTPSRDKPTEMKYVETNKDTQAVKSIYQDDSVTVQKHSQQPCGTNYMVNHGAVEETFYTKHPPALEGSANDDQALSRESSNIFRHTALRSQNSTKNKQKGMSRRRKDKKSKKEKRLTQTVYTHISPDMPAPDTCPDCEEPIGQQDKPTLHPIDISIGFRTDHSIPTALICSKCMKSETNIHTSGLCEDCLQYLCGRCVTEHAANICTVKHRILPCYCMNELMINKHVCATGYCRDCREMFCSKCVNNHSRLRRYRHHRILQSSFVNIPTTDPRTVEKESRSSPQQTEQFIETPNFSEKRDRLQQQHSALTLQARYAPYIFAYRDALPSLYPGPKTTMSGSYTSDPRWPTTSFPVLPVLLSTPRSGEREMRASRLNASHHKPLSESEVEVRMKKLKTLYGISDDAVTHQLRSNAGVNNSNDSSLPSFDATFKSWTTKGSLKPAVPIPKRAVHVKNYCLSIPFPSCEKPMVIRSMVLLMNGKLVVLDNKNNEVKLYNKAFVCTAALQFRNRLVDICASNLCDTDMYAATGKHVYEISALRGMELKRKMPMDVRRIEGLACWKYGLVVIWKKTYLTWELRLLDYRGNVKSQLEILNPMSCDIETSSLYHVTTSRRSTHVSITDTQNACILTVDVITKTIKYETALGGNGQPTYLTSDGESVFVSCGDRVVQVWKHGEVVGTVLEADERSDGYRCVVYNKTKGRLYVQIADDTIAVYDLRSNSKNRRIIFT